MKDLKKIFFFKDFTNSISISIDRNVSNVFHYFQKRVLLKKYILKVLEPQFDDVKKTKQGEPVKQSYFSVDYFQNNSQHVATVVLFLIFLLIMMIARALQVIIYNNN